jgi:hypothetical protein
MDIQAVGICTPHSRLYLVFHLTLVPALFIVNSCVYRFPPRLSKGEYNTWM